MEGAGAGRGAALATVPMLLGGGTCSGGGPIAAAVGTEAGRCRGGGRRLNCPGAVAGEASFGAGLSKPGQGTTVTDKGGEAGVAGPGMVPAGTRALGETCTVAGLAVGGSAGPGTVPGSRLSARVVGLGAGRTAAGLALGAGGAV